MTPSLTENAWAGSECWIVGGGPSLKEFDWSLLSGKKNIIAINMAYLNVPHADIWFSEDHRVITELITRKESLLAPWREFKGLKVWHCLGDTFLDDVRKASPDVHVVRKTRKDKFWAKKFSDGLSMSSNSAIGALNIADLLGAKTIYLLGIDCRVEGKESNYHSHYPDMWRMPRGQDASFASDFKHWAALHLRHREVVNLVTEEYMSAVDCWTRFDRDSFLKTGIPSRIWSANGR